MFHASGKSIRKRFIDAVVSDDWTKLHTKRTLRKRFSHPTKKVAWGKLQEKKKQEARVKALRESNLKKAKAKKERELKKRRAKTLMESNPKVDPPVALAPAPEPEPNTTPTSLTPYKQFLTSVYQQGRSAGYYI